MAKEMAKEGLPNLESRDRQLAMETQSVCSITSLPVEILWDIFNICDLKSQLSLAKVCKHFCQLVSEILERKFRKFVYNNIIFKFTLNLEDEEVTELCRLSGQNITHLCFSTYVSLELILHTVQLRTFNPIQFKGYINENFQQNLKYFPNLLELEIQGKFIQDSTFLELARKCRKLNSIKLIDGENRWMSGQNLAELESIEHLELKGAWNLEPNSLIGVSEKRPLKTLNIFGCKLFEDVPKMLQLCQLWQHLETLRLTAFTQDPTFLKAIVSLPMLKCLQFFWINFMPQGFEENFFVELKANEQKSRGLKSLKYENDRYFIEDESMQHYTNETYATMRENVCINGQKCQWTDEVFEKISRALISFNHLQSLDLIYCRLLSYEQLQQLPEINKSLKLIRIFGCPKKEDELFHKQWLESRNACQLKFELVLPLKDVLCLESEAMGRQFSSYYRREPILRSIECQFELPI